MTGIRMRTLLVVYYKPCVLYISTCHYIALASHRRYPVVSFVKLNACDIFTGRSTYSPQFCFGCFLDNQRWPEKQLVKTKKTEFVDGL